MPQGMIMRKGRDATGHDGEEKGRNATGHDDEEKGKMP
jgi:hypothetical protein